MLIRCTILAACVALGSTFALSSIGLSSPLLRATTSRGALRLNPITMAVSKDPKECYALCKGGEYVYLDVRTSEEYQAGAPVEAVNVPAFAKTDDGMLPMSSTFLKLVGINFPDKDVKLVVGCQSAVRSKSACMWLEGAGYKNIIENSGGYSGWTASGLPTE